MFFDKNKKQDNGINRRTYPRINDRNLVKLSRCDGATVERISNIFDLSEGGMRLVCRDNFPLGTILNLQINLVQHRKIISVNGKVVWIRPMKSQEGGYFAGIQFTNLTPGDRELLRKTADEGEM